MGPRHLWTGLAAVFAMAMLVARSAPAETPGPALQDMLIAGRVLGFQSPAPSGSVSIAIIVDRQDVRSRDEAMAIVARIGSGLPIGSLTLHAITVDQAQLAAAPPYGALFATIGVNTVLLGAAIRPRRDICLTRHAEPVVHGACLVAIQSVPSVAILVNESNAEAAGVHFATAFRMMVREI